VPLWLCMFFLLKDPPSPAQEEEHDHSVAGILRKMWGMLQSRVMLSLVVFAICNMAIANLLNPATNIISNIATPSTLQSSLGMFAGNIFFLLGVWIFRRFLMNKNWRYIFVGTCLMQNLNHAFELMVIYDAWGIGQNGWFYAFGNSMLSIVTGVAQLLTSMAVVEISPAGYEATVYEFITTVTNAGITMNSNLMNIFMPVFSLNGISHSTYNNYTRDAFNSRLAASTYFTMGLNVVGALVFMCLMPKDKAQCQAWLKDPRWNHWVIGVLGMVIGFGAMFFSFAVSFLSLFPSTACLQVAGGPGC